MSINSCLAYDHECKKLLHDKTLLSYILKLCVEEYKDISLKEIEILLDENKDTSHILARENEYITSMNEKIAYDVMFTSKYPKSSEKMDTFINLEVQNVYSVNSKENKPYPLIKRAIYYIATMVEMQKGPVFKHDNYQKLKKVNSLWINTKPPEHIKNTIQHYCIQEENKLPKIYKEKRINYDMINLVMLNLGEEENEQLGFLNELFARKNTKEEKYRNLEEKYGIVLCEKTKGVVENMCNLGEGILQEGIEQGIEQGISQGIGQRNIELVYKVMEERKVSFMEAFDYLFFTSEEKAFYRSYFE